MPAKDKRQYKPQIKVKNRRVTTINDILAKDDVNTILADLDKVKPHISDLVVIYMDRRDNLYHWLITEDTLTSTATWLLESTKHDLMHIEDGE